MDPTATTPAHDDTGERMNPVDAFERLCVEVGELEAVANAASAAIDECPPPDGPRRSFDRAQALIGNAAKKGAATVALIAELKSAVNAYVGKRR